MVFGGGDASTCFQATTTQVIALHPPPPLALIYLDKVEDLDDWAIVTGVEATTHLDRVASMLTVQRRRGDRRHTVAGRGRTR